jgi:hypothetical protein
MVESRCAAGCCGAVTCWTCGGGGIHASVDDIPVDFLC